MKEEPALPANPTARTRSKKLVFFAAMGLLLYLCLELLSCAAYTALEGEGMSLSVLDAERARLASAHVRTDSFAKKTRQLSHEYALHPFTGYVNAPGSTIKHYDEGMNRFGYAGDDDMFVIRDSDYVVAITGGSLSMRLFLDEQERIQQQIGRLRGIPTEDIKVICLGMSGFRQPQALMAVVYFLSLGGRIDLLLNVDGFNEIARLKRGLHPSYPTPWPRLVAGIAQSEEIQLVGRIATLRDRSASNARLFSHLRLSATANLLWLILERSLDRQIADLSTQLDRINEQTMHAATFAQAGPDLPQGVDLLDASIDAWVASSRQLRNLALGNGFSYYHFLQPNQYLNDTKRFTEAEKKKALNQAAKWSDKVNLGYARLRARAPELRRAGVDFTDLTGIFREVTETVYIDNCCHVNELGAELLSDAITQRIAASRRTPRAH